MKKHHRKSFAGLAVIAGCGILLNITCLAAEHDVIIRNGTVIDGSGSPRFDADVAIDQGIIVAIDSLEDAIGKTEINAEGKIVAPGFIDMMGQTATPLISQPQSVINLLSQGITTINAGNVISAAPIGSDKEWKTGFTSMTEYFHCLESTGIPLNVAQTVGHTQIRKIVLGDTNRRASDLELLAMQRHVKQAMEAGAVGLSSELSFPPATFDATNELCALAKIAGESGGRCFTQLRNDGDRVLEAVQEAIAIGSKTSAPVHIFHLKAPGQTNWGKVPAMIQAIESGRKKGLEITADINPYLHNGLGILAFIHPRHFSRGREKLIAELEDSKIRNEIRVEIETTSGWENWYQYINGDWHRLIVGHCSLPKYMDEAGNSLASIAAAHEEDPWETFFQLASVNAFVFPETMSEENIQRLTQQPFISFSTDAGPIASKQLSCHPRSFGSFPRLIREYVNTKKVISLEQAICQATANAAKILFAQKRGELKVGWAGDVIIFDELGVTDQADFKNPHDFSKGIECVLVNGTITYQNQKYTGARAGVILRGPGYQSSNIPTTKTVLGNTSSFNKIETVVHEFLKEHKIPGASIAITDSGKLIHSAGYGYADLGQKHPVETNSLFRIASISKPITAVAILQLVEKKRIKLTDRIYEKLNMTSMLNRVESDPRLVDITIEHLLQHRGGWDRNLSFDPMFQSIRFADQLGIPPPADSTNVIEAMMTQKLDFTPGERFAYSNFGYCLLGRLIEQSTGQSYEEYVKQNVLSPLGIHSMCLGKTKLTDKNEKEVRYYHPFYSHSVYAEHSNVPVPSHYGGWHLEAMDSHGGWLASAKDLAIFATAFDDPDQCPILSRQSISMMYKRPSGLAGFDQYGKPKSVYYSLGWNNRTISGGRTNQWHSGSLPGTSTIMIRRHDGKNFVGLLNTRVTPTGKSLGLELDRLMHRVANLSSQKESAPPR